jgi:hypothetical protein
MIALYILLAWIGLIAAILFVGVTWMVALRVALWLRLDRLAPRL